MWKSRTKTTLWPKCGSKFLIIDTSGELLFVVNDNCDEYYLYPYSLPGGDESYTKKEIQEITACYMEIPDHIHPC